MDPAAVFQQGLGPMMPRAPQYFGHHFQQPPPFPPPAHPATPLRRPPTAQRDDDDGNSHRIAHTLTACCRCRQASTLCRPSCTPSPIVKCQNHNVIISFAHLSGEFGNLNPDFILRLLLLTMLTVFSPNDSAKRDVILPFLDVSRASDPVPSANTSTPLVVKRSADSTLSSYKRRCANSRPSSRSIPTTTMTILRAPRTLYGLVDSSSSMNPTRRRDIWGPVLGLP